LAHVPASPGARYGGRPSSPDDRQSYQQPRYQSTRTSRRCTAPAAACAALSIRRGLGRTDAARLRGVCRSGTAQAAPRPTVQVQSQAPPRTPVHAGAHAPAVPKRPERGVTGWLAVLVLVAIAGVGAASTSRPRRRSRAGSTSASWWPPWWQSSSCAAAPCSRWWSRRRSSTSPRPRCCSTPLGRVARSQGAARLGRELARVRIPGHRRGHGGGVDHRWHPPHQREIGQRAARRSRRSSCGRANVSRSSVCILLPGRCNRARPASRDVADEHLRNGCAAGQPHRRHVSQPRLVDGRDVLDEMRRRGAAARATSTMRTELDEFAEPTTRNRSTSGAITFTAACRFCVA